MKYVPLISIDQTTMKDAYLITGYQGFGLVGYLTTLHMVRELELEKIGFIKTRYMPDITMYTRRHGIQYPFEIYYGKVGYSKLIVIVNNGTPVPRERTEYAEYIAQLAKEINTREVILVGGLSHELKEQQEEKYRWIPINNTSIRLDNAKILEERHVIGPLALTMMFTQAYKLNGVVILPFTEPYRPDPRASAVAVEVISRILGLEISIEKLMEESRIIEAIEEERAKIERALVESEKRSRLTYI
ncbi:MAG: PAC2 family protein [Desulfurococcaceae archaeon]